MFELIPDGIIATFIVVVGIVIGLIVRRKNIEYLKSETKPEHRRQILRPYMKAIPNCAKCRLRCPLGVNNEGHSQPNEQHQGQETTKIKHEINQE